MPQASVFIRRDGAVATIHLNRPAQKNALTGEMWRMLLKALDQAESDIAVKVIVITGEGEAFPVGADFKEGLAALVDKRKLNVPMS